LVIRLIDKQTIYLHAAVLTARSEGWFTVNAAFSTIISCAIVAAIPTTYIYTQKPYYHLYAIYIASIVIIFTLFLVSILVRMTINRLFSTSLSVSTVRFSVFGCAALLIFSTMLKAHSNVFGMAIAAFGVAVLGMIAGAIFAITTRSKKPA